MKRASDLDAIADACIAAHAVIAEHGTPQMKMLSRVLLHIVGKEIARNLSSSQHEDDQALHGEITRVAAPGLRPGRP
ncbi:hypothetical protein [Methylobacterium sp. E-066]|uniref:hypothetical protein n=1 Tax=Methylobacterium sp. E-066 TaxID=2836584 RepID=UPI001FB8EE9F|nr:hypothetical protein [Methylobacterium sp. E-066]MCJ2144705.1 hypothetical protein [Methylobacterium sp. E-066]